MKRAVGISVQFRGRDSPTVTDVYKVIHYNHTLGLNANQLVNERLPKAHTRLRKMESVYHMSWFCQC